MKDKLRHIHLDFYIQSFSKWKTVFLKNKERKRKCCLNIEKRSNLERENLQLPLQWNEHVSFIWKLKSKKKLYKTPIIDLLKWKEAVILKLIAKKVIKLWLMFLLQLSTILPCWWMFVSKSLHKNVHFIVFRLNRAATLKLKPEKQKSFQTQKWKYVWC